MSDIDEKQERQVGLFDFINDISYDKNNLLNDDTQTVYNSYMINKAFSQHIDTIMLANELNKRPEMSKEMHHDFLFHGVDAKKRYGKWAKQEKSNDEVVAYLKETYEIGSERALEYLRLMTSDEIKDIEQKLKTRKGRK